MKKISRFSSFKDESYPKHISIHRMKDELTYHYNHYQKNKAEHQTKCMKYDIFAYINVVGRIYYFLSDNKLLHLTPKVKEKIDIRHKYTAHRSSDKKMKKAGKVVELDKEENANSIDSVYSGTTTDGQGNIIISEMGFGLDDKGNPIKMPGFSIHDEHELIMKEIDVALSCYEKNHNTT